MKVGFPTFRGHASLLKLIRASFTASKGIYGSA